MSSKSMSLKAKINNMSKQKSITAQALMQNFMFERFLERLSISNYFDKFIIKGGMLISSIVGISNRSTMDLDTTVTDIVLNESAITEAIINICSVKLKDDCLFEFISLSNIRIDDPYGGFRVRIDAIYESIRTPLSIDVSTGDAITPSPVKYTMTGLFDDNLKIELFGYNIETVLAEKVEAILSRGVDTTRPRDYYDVYILTTTQKFDKHIFFSALNATCLHRNTSRILVDNSILQSIKEDTGLRKLWKIYQKRFSYAATIDFDQILIVLENLLKE